MITSITTERPNHTLQLTAASMAIRAAGEKSLSIVVADWALRAAVAELLR